MSEVEVYSANYGFNRCFARNSCGFAPPNHLCELQAGGKVCIGSNGQFQGLGYRWEMWALASGGAPNMDVLRAAAIRGAEALGLAQDLGSIELGKLADLVVLNKNPLDDIHNTNTIEYVMKNGELFEGNTPSTKSTPNRGPFGHSGGGISSRGLGYESRGWRKL
jgi:hypothetical protein